jgi:hypothetical protein
MRASGKKAMRRSSPLGTGLRHSMNHMIFLGLRLEMWNIKGANGIKRRDERIIQPAAAAGGAQCLTQLSQRPQYSRPIESLPRAVLAKAHRR